jgi:hypothetical protein
MLLRFAKGAGRLRISPNGASLTFEHIEAVCYVARHIRRGAALASR